jgi:GTP cyclohydrolase I
MTGTVSARSGIIADEQLDRHGVDVPRSEEAARELLLAVGEDPDREGLR